MQLTNNTAWSTADLRAIVSRIAKTELDARHRKAARITFAPSKHQRMERDRRGYCSTSGYVFMRDGYCARRRLAAEKNSVFISMPTVFDTLNERERIDLCVTIAHEFAHIRTQARGPAAERAMRSSIPYGRPKGDEAKAAQAMLYAWVLAMPLRKKSAVEPAPAAAIEEPPPAAKPLIARRAEKAAATVAKWEAELSRRERAVKRAKAKLAKARRRVAYYDRAAARPAGK